MIAGLASDDDDDDARYRALTTRDRRFDGVFFVGVRTTGVYCRPICPARTPRRSSCEFYAHAAQAEKAGYRACFRCRPELAPGHADVDAVDVLVERAAARIAEGALDRSSVEELARALGVSGRQLRRAMEARLGVAPLELAQTHRLALGKRLLQDTALPITEVAFAAGFRSVRRFNAVFAERLGVAPRALRQARRAPREARLVLRLDYRAPYGWDDLLAFLAARAIPGVEVVAHDTYRRVVHVGDGADGATGVIEVSRPAGRDALQLALAPSLAACVLAIVARVRRLFDLDAHPDEIGAVLARDPLFAPRVAARPGLRLPGAIDPFEAAVRALLGQQVSVAAATTLAGRFVARFGTALATPAPPLTHRFPTAREVARATPAAIAAIGLPGARAAGLHALACAIVDGRLRFETRELAPFVAAAVALPGIGPWTAHYLAMRALHLPDAFPASDLGILHATGLTPKLVEARAEVWRPFRAYAVMHLWTGGSDAVNEVSDRVGDHPGPVRRAHARRDVDAPRRRLPAGAAAARRAAR